MKIIFLDDERVPSDVKWVKYPEAEIVVVRTLGKFLEAVDKAFMNSEKFGISFDHDIQQFGPDGEITGKTCACYLCNLHQEEYSHLDFPEYWVHSMNPIGAHNIRCYIEGYKLFVE